MALSRGVTTAFVQTTALAPVYFVVTVTSVGAIFGNWVIGNWVSDNAPTSVIKMEMTIERTGLLINRVVMIIFWLKRWLVSYLSQLSKLL
jgi:hypothetical protein